MRVVRGCSLLAFMAMPRKDKADRVRCPGCSREMTLGSLLDTHLKGSPQCRTAYEAAEEEKRKANSARLFGRALTTEPPNKPDGGSSASGTKAPNKVNSGALDSNSSSVLAGFELLGQQMHLMHKEAMNKIDFLESRLGQRLGSMQQQLNALQQAQQVQQVQQQQKKPAALTAVTNVDDLVRYYPVLQCTPEKLSASWGKKRGCLLWPSNFFFREMAEQITTPPAPPPHCHEMPYLSVLRTVLKYVR